MTHDRERSTTPVRSRCRGPDYRLPGRLPGIRLWDDLQWSCEAAGKDPHSLHDVSARRGTARFRARSRCDHWKQVAASLRTNHEARGLEARAAASRSRFDSPGRIYTRRPASKAAYPAQATTASAPIEDRSLMGGPTGQFLDSSHEPSVSESAATPSPRQRLRKASGSGTGLRNGPRVSYRCCYGPGRVCVSR